MAFVAHVANIGFTKHQLFADISNAAPIAQQFEIPTAVHRIAIQTCADQLVVANDEFFVDTFVGVAQDYFFGRSVGTAHEVARAEQIDASDFEFGGGERTGIAANSVFRQMVGQDFALLKQRCDQTIGDTAVRCTFTHGVNARVGDGLQRVCDHNAALAIQAHFFSQGGVGTNAHCHHHQFC